jgi:hypothetical protein
MSFHSRVIATILVHRFVRRFQNMLDIPSHATKDTTLNEMQSLGQPGQNDHPFSKSPTTVHHEQIEASSPEIRLTPASDIPSNPQSCPCLDSTDREGRRSLSSIELAIHPPSQESAAMTPGIRIDSELGIATLATDNASESRYTSSLAPIDGGYAAWSFVCICPC